MSSNAFRKLPPEVRRELLRHVKPSSRTSSRPNTSSAKHEDSERSRTTRNWLLGCVGFVGCAATMPVYASYKIGNLTDRDDPLTAAQVRRGAFMNSGSRDAGKDENWDLKTGTYIYPEGFAKHLSMQDPEETDFGPDLGPMVQNQKRQQGKPPTA